MKKRVCALVLCLVLFLSGCSWMEGSYVYVEPHQEQVDTTHTGAVSASSYSELMAVMEELVMAGSESSVIDVSGYNQRTLENNMEAVCRYILEIFPVGSYAVDEISYEVGTNNGRPAVAVTVHYRRSRMEIQQIRKKKDMASAAASIYAALEDYSSRVVVLVENYTATDFDQLVQDYAREHPQTVMEIPQISEGIYGVGSSRVIELNFSYQNSREALRLMQTQVRPVFEAAVLYVSGEGSEHQKFFQLCSFLTERFDYQNGTSITPSYSLLCHGVGDSRAFAEVYASMCGRVGLECAIVTGTRDGEPWTWNMVRENDVYYHVDLVRCGQEGGFREYCDAEMVGYVWDYSAYPACETFYQAQPVYAQEDTVSEATEETVPEETVPEETVPEETEPLETSPKETQQ